MDVAITHEAIGSTSAGEQILGPENLAEQDEISKSTHITLNESFSLAFENVQRRQ